MLPCLASKQAIFFLPCASLSLEDASASLERMIESLVLSGGDDDDLEDGEEDILIVGRRGECGGE